MIMKKIIAVLAFGLMLNGLVKAGQNHGSGLSPRNY